MADQIVPLTNAPDQTLAVSLLIDGGTTTLQLRVRYAEVAGYWLMTAQDRTGVTLLDSLPLVTGYYPAANLLAQHAYLKIGSAFVVNASGIDEDSPDAANLGSDFVLVWSDSPAF